VPRPIPVPVRQKIYERALQGESTASLAAAFRLPVRTVRHLCRRFRERGADAIRPDYHPADPLPHTFGDAARDAALALRRAHPTWGPS
jgi:Helix-turn-helix domain